MRLGLSRVALALSLWSGGRIGAAVLVVVVEACGGSQVAPAGSQTDAQVVCPASPAEAIGAACGVEGLRCGPQYTCGIFQVSLLCACTGGVFQCTDGTGQRLKAGATPMCPATLRSSSCPATERGAQLLSCSEQGLLCAYPSGCPSRYDQCQCFPGVMADGGFGLRFECNPAVCGGYDAGTIIFDSGSPSDSAAGQDTANVPDAGHPLDAGTSPDSDSGSDGPIGADVVAADTRAE